VTVMKSFSGLRAASHMFRRDLHHHHCVGIIGAPFSKGQQRDGVQRGADLIRAAGLVQKLKGEATFQTGFSYFPLKEVGNTDHAFDQRNRWRATALDCTIRHSRLTIASVFWHMSIPIIPNFSWLKPCVAAKDVVYIGLRDVDPGEHYTLKYLGIKAFSMTEVDRLGIAKVMEQTCDHMFSKVKKPIHLSFDIDALDPSVSPATGTPVAGGLTYREGIYITEHICQTGLLSAVDMVEVNPKQGKTEDEIKSTVNAAVDLLLGCFGRVREGSHDPDYKMPNP
uniref:Arginase 1 n=1 Tax=Cyprinus carpio TaxID=7962 RepID=A0A8C1LMT9_CYPCA